MDSFVIFLAKDLFVSVVIVWLVAYFIIARSKRLEFAFALVVAAVVAFALSKIASALYFHSRPFTTSGVKALIPHTADNGFPSDHTVLVMTLSSLIYYYHRRLAAIVFILGLAVGAGRVWAHVHSWIDILGGLVVGFVAGYIGFEVARFIVKKITLKHTPQAAKPE